MTTRNDIKLCDFSFARYADRDRRLYDTFCGVVAFTAPEILLCKPYSPELSEVWSIGVVVYSMVYGALPFNPTHHAQLIKVTFQLPLHITWQLSTKPNLIAKICDSQTPRDHINVTNGLWFTHYYHALLASEYISITDPHLLYRERVKISRWKLFSMQFTYRLKEPVVLYRFTISSQCLNISDKGDLVFTQITK